MSIIFFLFLLFHDTFAYSLYFFTYCDYARNNGENSKEEIMEKFAIGVLLGVVGGAILTANNYKMRALVKKSQADVQEKIDALMDEKLKELDQTADDIGDAVQEKAQDIKERVKKKAKKVQSDAKKKIDELVKAKPKQSTAAKNKAEKTTKKKKTPATA